MILNNILEMQNVSLYINTIPILHNINWEVNKGEHWAIIGPNGAGKSFFVKLLHMDLFPSSGHININGHYPGKTSIWDINKTIGYISFTLQQSYKAHVTLRNVILSGFFSSIGIYQTITSHMEEQCDIISEFLGIESLLNKKYSACSQGEQRIALIARALIHNPEFLLLDEPCNGLDIPSREKFLSIISQLAEKGHTIILITHHIEEIIPEITHVAYIKKGFLYNSGSKDEMLNQELLTEVFDYPILLEKHNDRYFSKIN